MILARRATPGDAEELVRLRKNDLHASREGEPLYASLGFARTPDPSMRLTFQDLVRPDPPQEPARPATGRTRHGSRH
ncbi:hypothetical protein [Streptomyces sp. AK02-01A]|uniref:hypothetical protein n=1 Tax=Streptomyces sp. AK02-01A TaxID=3028648 RepID=UPI0039F6F49D